MRRKARRHPRGASRSRASTRFRADPLIILYNKLILPENERPKSMAQLVELAAKDPKKFQNKMATYDATGHPFAKRCTGNTSMTAAKRLESA